PGLATFERCWLGGATGRVQSPWRSSQATRATYSRFAPPDQSARSAPRARPLKRTALLAKPVNGINAPQRPDCVAGVGGLELRNVIPKYRFERSHRFSVIQPNSGRRDHSRSSCGVAETQLGLVPGHSCANAGRSLRWQELPRFCLRASYYHARVQKRPKQAGAGMGRRRPMIELEGDSHQPTNKISSASDLRRLAMLEEEAQHLYNGGDR